MSDKPRLLFTADGLNFYEKGRVGPVSSEGAALSVRWMVDKGLVKLRWMGDPQRDSTCKDATQDEYRRFLTREIMTTAEAMEKELGIQYVPPDESVWLK